MCPRRANRTYKYATLYHGYDFTWHHGFLLILKYDNFTQRPEHLIIRHTGAECMQS